MTTINTYLRRMDVEGMLQLKIDACASSAADARTRLDKLPPSCAGQSLDIRNEIMKLEAKEGALRVALSHLKFCEQFTLHDGAETNEAGIAELRDAAGNNVEPDNRRWKNEG